MANSPGGAHVFTIPWYPKEETVLRARRQGQTIEHLLPASYHGNPIDAQGSLVVREWGRDMLKFIRENAGMHVAV